VSVSPCRVTPALPDAVVWSLQAPPLAASSPAEAPWLAELRSVRARVLYDGGRRPGFRAVDGRHRDPDPVDLHAYHILVRRGDELLGAIRLLPLISGQPGTLERLLGTERLERVIADLGAGRSQAVEAGGWVVVPPARGTGVGKRLLTATVALSWHLGARLWLGAAGTRDGQDRILARLGVRFVPDRDTLPLPGYADEVRLVYVTPDEGGPELAGPAAAMAASLGLHPLG
jgi:GNAT superfamily N-acetyltransferase